MTPNLAHFGLNFGSILGPFWGLKMTPLRGAILSQNTMNSKGFGAFQPPKGAPFWATFGAQIWLNSGPHFGPILAPFGVAFWASPNPPFCLVFGPAWPAPGAEVKKFSPDPSQLKGFSRNILENFLKNFRTEEIF